MCVPVATCYVVVTWFGFLCSCVSPGCVNWLIRLWRKVQYFEIKHAKINCKYRYVLRNSPQTIILSFFMGSWQTECKIKLFSTLH